MTSFRSVLAFGDSHVAGCELSNKIYEYLDGTIAIEEADEFGKQTEKKVIEVTVKFGQTMKKTYEVCYDFFRSKFNCTK